MTRHWALQDAKARLSKLVRAAEKEPQRITVRGKPTAVLISESEYRRLTGEVKRPKRSFAEWWKATPRVPEFKLPSGEHRRPGKARPLKIKVQKAKPKSLADVLLATPRVRGFKLPPRV